MKTIRTLAAVAVGLTSMLAATSAFAQQPSTAPAMPPAQPATTASTNGETSDAPRPISVSLLLGYGFNDAFKLGFGLRAGYTLPMGLYIGGTFVYHLGTSIDLPPAFGGSYTVNVMYPGAEVGYDIQAGPVIVRPYGGLGLALVSGPTIAGISTSSSNVAFWPGATVMYPLGNAFIGADARFVIVSGANALGTFLTGGLRF